MAGNIPADVKLPSNASPSVENVEILSKTKGSIE